MKFKNLRFESILNYESNIKCKVWLDNILLYNIVKEYSSSNRDVYYYVLKINEDKNIPYIIYRDMKGEDGPIDIYIYDTIKQAKCYINKAYKVIKHNIIEYQKIIEIITKEN